MTPEQELAYLQEVASRIGHFYLNKNKNDLTACEKEVTALRITDIKVVFGEPKNTVIISLSRPGLLIGNKGQNIQKLSDFLDMGIKIVEAENWLNWLVPYQQDIH